jgi:hypothetical protein
MAESNKELIAGSSSIDTCVIPTILSDAIGKDSLRGLFTPPPDVNSCPSNFLHCRDNQIFQAPFCLCWPVAGISWVICLPFQICGGNVSFFTRKNMGSILAITNNKILKYTPKVESGSCCFKVTYDETVKSIIWEDFVEAQRAQVRDESCGVGSSLSGVIGVCCIFPCANVWGSCCETGPCSFEDVTVRLTFYMINTESSKKYLAFYDYGPDYRAKAIRNFVKDQSWISQTQK